MNPATASLVVAMLAACLATQTLAASVASAAAPVRFSKLFSTQDGNVQAIELQIDPSATSPLALGGKRLVVRDTHGQERTQVLVLDTPWWSDGPIQRGALLLSSSYDSFEYRSDAPLDRDILPTDGGSIEIEGLDAWTFGPLPLDGRSALARDGSVVPAEMSRHGINGQHTTAVYDVDVLFAREHRHAETGHYFVTSSLAESRALERGAVPGWSPTGMRFRVWIRPDIALAPPESMRPFCRWFLPYEGGYTHLLSGDEDECEALHGARSGILESPAIFYAAVPDAVTGICPTVPGSTGRLNPIYRLWNGSAQPNHRWVQQVPLRDSMVAQGWVSEGAGPLGVALCE